MELGFLGLLLCDVLTHAKRSRKQHCEHQNSFHKGFFPSVKVRGAYHKDPGVLCLSVLVEGPRGPRMIAVHHFWPFAYFSIETARQRTQVALSRMGHRIGKKDPEGASRP